MFRFRKILIGLAAFALLASVFLTCKAAEDAVPTYTVHYDAGGGTGTQSSSIFAYNSKITLPDCHFKAPEDTPDEYFVYWDTEPDGTGTHYKPNEKYSSLTTGSDITLYAVWGYKVTFETFKGTPVSSQVVPTGGFVGKPADPSLTDNIFYGWYSSYYKDGEDDKFSGLWEFDLSLDQYRIYKNTTLYAQFYQGEGTLYFNVTFETYNGSVNPSYKAAAETKIPATAIKTTLTGYRIENWYTDGTFSNSWNMDNPVKSDMTLYAKWVADTYFVAYDSNGGSGAPMNTDKLTYDQPFTLSSNTYTRTGYEFAGWALSATGSATYTDGQQVVDKNLSSTQDATVTLFAKWEIKQYKVSFNSNGGGTAPAPISADYNTNITLPGVGAMLKTSSAFSSWNTQQDGQGTKYLPGNFKIPPNDVTLYAQWDDAYYVTFDLNGGSGITPEQPPVVGNSDIVLPGATQFSRTGYTLRGWNVNQNGTGSTLSAGSFYTVYNQDVKFYAIWTPIQYSIAYDKNTTDPKVTVTMPTSSGINYDSDFTLSSNQYIRPGYIFNGWNTAQDGKGKAYTDCETVKSLKDTAGTVYLYAQWTPITYTIRYDKNAGDATGTVNDTQHTYDVPQNISANKYTRPNYNFTKWNTNPNGTGQDIASGATVSNLTETNGAVVSLYAQWSAGDCYYSYSSNGGSNPPAGGTVPYGTSVSLANPGSSMTKTGYTFAGWTVDTADAGTVYASSYSYPITGTVTFYAKWNPISYTVAYMANSGTGTQMGTSTFTYAASNNKLLSNTYQRTGYAFLGWSLDSGATAASYTDGYTLLSSQNLSSTTGTVNLFAIWKANTYTVVFNKSNASETGTTMANQSFSYDEQKALNPNSYQRTGYNFGGWATSANGDKVYDPGQSVKNLTATPNGTVNLYTYWAANKVTVTFYNGATVVSTQSIDYGTAPVKPDDPIQAGSTFSGWYSAQTGGTKLTIDNTYLVYADTKIYAQFGANAFTVIFHGNGNTNSTTMANLNVNYGSTTKLTPVAFTRTGYAFAGWATSATGSVVYADQASAGTMSTGAQVDLYAIWTPYNYTVTFDRNNLDAVGPLPNDISCKYDTAQPLPQINFTLRGYKFLGWSTSQTATTYGTGLTPTGQILNLTTSNNVTVTLYAVWQKVSGNVDGATLKEKLDWLANNAIDNTSYTITAPSSTIEIVGNYNLSFTGSTGIVVYLKSDTTTVRTVSVSSGTMFTVGTGVTLYLDSYITLKGISNNTAPLVRVNTGGTFEMTNSTVTITGNISSSNGGGVYIADGTVNMRNGYISSNTGPNGGGVYVSGGTFNLIGGNIQSNTTASGGNGGGVCVSTGSVLVVKGGSSNPVFNMTGGTIQSNTAANGGGVFVYGAVNTGIIGKNTSVDGKFLKTGGTIQSNTATGGTANFGTAVYMSTTPANIRDAAAGTTVNMDSTKCGAAGGWLPPVYSTSTPASAFSWISSNAYSGNTYIVQVTADCTISPTPLYYSGLSNINITFRSDSATTRTVTLGSSGAMFTVNSGVALTLDTITLKGISTNNSALVYVYTGGTFYMQANSSIQGNTNTSYGGGVYLSGGTVRMYDGSISGNSTSFYGGGVYIDSGTFTMDNGTIYGNNSGSGGGIYELGGRFTMNGGTISTNNANNVSNGSGAGIYINGGICTIGTSGLSYTTSFNITKNKAAVNGGGIFNNGGSLSLNSGYIQSNSAGNNGGGIYNGPTYASFDMYGGTISNNSATNLGGGVYDGGQGLYLNAGTISNNSAGYGGGVYGRIVQYGGNISSNSATYAGGGVCIPAIGTTSASIIGGTIDNNISLQNGGGVFISGGFYSMSGGTISNNRAYMHGGGVFVDLYFGGSGTRFVKSSGGAIYGYTSGGSFNNNVTNSSNVLQTNCGHAVYVMRGSTYNTSVDSHREVDAGTPINLDSAVTGSGGGW